MKNGSSSMDGACAMGGGSVAGVRRASERRLRPAGAGIVAVSPAGRLRCAPSGRGRAPELAARQWRSAQTAGASQSTKRAARAAPVPAVLAATQTPAPAGHSRHPLATPWRLGQILGIQLVKGNSALAGHRGRANTRGQQPGLVTGLTRTDGVGRQQRCGHSGMPASRGIAFYADRTPVDSRLFTFRFAAGGTDVETAAIGRVEMWRGDGRSGIAVAAPFGWLSE